MDIVAHELCVKQTVGLTTDHRVIFSVRKQTQPERSDETRQAEHK